jgi:hypothetical protein
MLIGDPKTFAIECYHDPLPNETRRVFGRMCLWVAGAALGDITEPACMLNVTEGFLQDTLNGLETLDDPALRTLSDREAYALLDRALYLDDERSNEQVSADSDRFGKFNFLTNCGESFDRTNSFIIGNRDAENLRILFEDEQGHFWSGSVAQPTFILTVRRFLAWVADEGKNAG